MDNLKLARALQAFSSKVPRSSSVKLEAFKIVSFNENPKEENSGYKNSYKTVAQKNQIVNQGSLQ